MAFITLHIGSASSIVLAIIQTQSMFLHAGNNPSVLIVPKVGFNPTTSLSVARTLVLPISTHCEGD
jgi:hypothetical protein